MYTHILSVLIKGSQFFINYICDATHHKKFGLVLTALNELHRHMVFILDDIIVFLCRLLYDLLCVMFSFQFPLGF